ncbi:O-antigen ligase family protein [Natronococcus occultus]|uniref:Lipid A core-O-antigen ligase-like enyme n=1 Tax=Natronococcus occultus SP4 TaxID=694430 RepID=L0K4J2_9EURY|nr:hypothetical protein [Natronococcus occultus]AGB39028.1 hypothetical protein Natoc_3291 [Natronococcus occultus SP4]
MVNRAGAAVGAAIVLAGAAPTTWLLESTVGYVLAGAILAALLAAGIARNAEDGRLETVVLERLVVAVLALYWLGLVGQFALTGSLSVLAYVVLTPIVVLTLWYGCLPIVLADPRSFLGGFVGTVSALTLLGVGLLVLEWGTALAFPWTGNNVFGIPGLRVASIYGNPNAFGFAAAVASLGALWATLETRRRRWAATLPVPLAGLVLSDATMALMAFGAATAVLLVLRSPTLGLAVAGSGAVLAVGFFQTDLGASYLTLLVERGGSERVAFWTAALSRAAENPLVGAGFDHGLPTHNSIVAIVLNAGVLVGGLYVLVIAGAVRSALAKARTGTPWDGFVLAAMTLLVVQMLTESFTLGGLSTTSLVLATFVGLALVEASERRTIPLPNAVESERDDRPANPNQ